MPQAQGSSAKIQIQQEPNFKQQPSTPDCTLVYFKSESLRSTRNLITSEVIRGSRNPIRPVLGNRAVEGDIVTELSAYMNILFRAALGNHTTVGSTPPYTHTFKIANTLPSFLIEKGFTDISSYHRYSGCKVNSMTLNVTPEGFQEITFNFMGASETLHSTPFDSTPTDRTFRPFDGFSIASIEEGGSTIAYVTAVDVTLNNNLDGTSYVIGGQGERRYLPEGVVAVSGTLRALFEDTSLYTKALNSTKTSLKITYQFGNGSGSAGNEYIEFLIPELIYQPQAPVITSSGGVVVELPFQAFYDTSTQQTAFQIIVKNTTASV